MIQYKQTKDKRCKAGQIWDGVGGGIQGKDGVGEKGMVYGHCEETQGGVEKRKNGLRRWWGGDVEEGEVMLWSRGRKGTWGGDWDLLFYVLQT